MHKYHVLSSKLQPKRTSLSLNKDWNSIPSHIFNKTEWIFSKDQVISSCKYRQWVSELFFLSWLVVRMGVVVVSFKGENQVANWLSVCKWNVPTNHRSIQEMLNKSYDKQDHTLFHIVNFPSFGWLVMILRLRFQTVTETYNVPDDMHISQSFEGPCLFWGFRFQSMIITDD